MEAAVRKVVGHNDFAAKFKHPLKFDGENYVEVRLGTEEQVAEVTKLAGKSPHVFLERYGDLLSREELIALRDGYLPQSPSPEVQFWLDRLMRMPLSEAEQAKVARRRRWNWAKVEMAKGDGFFSEEEMKHRDPKLFRELVGRHLDPSARLTAPMKGGLSSYLLQQLDAEDDMEAEEDIGPVRGEDEDGCRPAKTRRTNPATDDAKGEADADDDDAMDLMASDGEGGEGGGQCLDIADRRAQFLKAMRNRFVNGSEKGFDYSGVDVDSDLDDLAELSRDAEERYFDD